MISCELCPPNLTVVLPKLPGVFAGDPLYVHFAVELQGAPLDEEACARLEEFLQAWLGMATRWWLWVAPGVTAVAWRQLILYGVIVLVAGVPILAFAGVRFALAPGVSRALVAGARKLAAAARTARSTAPGIARAVHRFIGVRPRALPAVDR